MGLVLCLDIQALAVEVKLDATTAISLVLSNSRTNGSLFGLVDDCRELLLQMPQVKVSHCFREANLCADALAKMGAAASDGGACFVCPPPLLLTPFYFLIVWVCIVIGCVLLFVILSWF